MLLPPSPPVRSTIPSNSLIQLPDEALRVLLSALGDGRPRWRGAHDALDVVVTLPVALRCHRHTGGGEKDARKNQVTLRDLHFSPAGAAPEVLCYLCAHVPLGALLYFARRSPCAKRCGSNLKKSGGLSASPAVTSMPRVVCRFDAESDEAARMEPSSEMPNFCGTQRPVPCLSLTTTASSTTLKLSGTTAVETSMFFYTPHGDHKQGKGSKGTRKRERENTPTTETRRKGRLLRQPRLSPEARRTGWRASCRLRVATDQFSMCVFLSKKVAKLKREGVSWLSKILVFYFMTDLGYILSFYTSGFNNTLISGLDFF